MAQSNPSVPIHPAPRHLLGICHLVALGGGKLSEHLCPGLGHLSILLEAVNIGPFLIFQKKIYTHLDSL